MYIYLCEYLNGNHRKNNKSKSFSDLRQSKDFPFINHRPPPPLLLPLTSVLRNRKQFFVNCPLVIDLMVLVLKGEGGGV